MDARAEPALAFSWRPCEAHQSLCYGIPPPGTAGLVESWGGPSRAHGRVVIAAVTGLHQQSPGAAPVCLGGQFMAAGPMLAVVELDGLCLPVDVVRGSENIPEAALLLLIAQQWARGC